jgi:hypothetical protein
MEARTTGFRLGTGDCAGTTVVYLVQLRHFSAHDALDEIDFEIAEFDGRDESSSRPSSLVTADGKLARSSNHRSDVP